MANNDHIIVRVGRLPGRITDIALNGDRSVSAALAAAEIDAAGYEARLNGSPAEPATLMEEGDTLLLVKKIKGN